MKKIFFFIVYNIIKIRAKKYCTKHVYLIDETAMRSWGEEWMD